MQYISNNNWKSVIFSWEQDFVNNNINTLNNNMNNSKQVEKEIDSNFIINYKF